MSVSGVGDGSSASFEAVYGATMAKKAQDQQKADADGALQLVESAKAPPPKPGHQLSVMA